MKRISNSKALLIFSLVLATLLFGGIGLVLMRKPHTNVAPTLVIPPSASDSLLQRIMIQSTVASDTISAPWELQRLYQK